MSSKWAKFHSTYRSNVYNSQARRQDFAAGGMQKSRGGGTFFKYNIECTQQSPRKVARDM